MVALTSADCPLVSSCDRLAASCVAAACSARSFSMSSFNLTACPSAVVSYSLVRSFSCSRQREPPSDGRHNGAIPQCNRVVADQQQRGTVRAAGLRLLATVVCKSRKWHAAPKSLRTFSDVIFSLSSTEALTAASCSASPASAALSS